MFSLATNPGPCFRRVRSPEPFPSVSPLNATRANTPAAMPIPIPGGGARRPVQIGSKEEALELQIQKQLLPSVGMNIFSRFKLSKNENDDWTLSDRSSTSNSSIDSISDLYSYLVQIRVNDSDLVQIRDNDSECQTIIKLFNDKFSLAKAFDAWRSNLVS